MISAAVNAPLAILLVEILVAGAAQIAMCATAHSHALSVKMILFS
jgi:hypothetical protein